MSNNPQSAGETYFFGATPPRAISDQRLKVRHFRVLGAVAIRDQMSLVNGGDGCWSSIKSLATLAGMNYSNFSSAIGELVTWGYLERTKGNRDRRTLTLRVVYSIADNEPWLGERAENSLPQGQSTTGCESEQPGQSFATVTNDSGEIVCQTGEIVCHSEKISQQDQSDAAHNIPSLRNPDLNKPFVVAQSAKIEVLDSLPGTHLDEEDVKWAIEYWLEQGREDLARDAKGQLYSFEDYHRSKGNRFKDWSAAWRNWCRKAPGFPPRNDGGRKLSAHDVFFKAALSLGEEAEQRAAEERLRQEADKARFAAGGWLDRAATEPMQVFEEIYSGLKLGEQPTEEAIAALGFIVQNNPGKHIADIANRELLYCRRLAA